MALTISVSRGFTMTAGYAPTVADWNAAFLPTVTVAGGVDSGDIADDAVTFALLNPNLLISGTAITALATGDFLLVGDVSSSDNRVITVANALNGIFSLAGTAATAFTSYSADLFTLHNGTAAVTMTPARLAEQLIAQAPSLTATVDADEVLVHDASATDGSQAVRVSLANLLPDKVTAGSYTGIFGLTLDAKGRVTAVVSGGSNVAQASVRDTGAAGYAPQSIPATTETVLRFTTATSASWLALASNEITLSAGTYSIDAVVPIADASSNSKHTILLYDNTAGAAIATATSQISGDQDEATVHLKAVFTLAVQSVVTLRAYVSAGPLTIGRAVSNASYAETFAQALFTRLA